MFRDSLNQTEQTIELTRNLLAALEGSKDFGTTKNAVLEFINKMDGCNDGPLVLGDMDVLHIAAAYLKRRGKSYRWGAMLLGMGRNDEEAVN